LPLVNRARNCRDAKSSLVVVPYARYRWRWRGG
jgi:hypothetical protein